jgi:tetratricopeptide (TPR) repeat protein
MVYLGQMVWPAGLAVLYPFPQNGLPRWELMLAATLLAGFSAAAIWQRRKQPWLLIGWLWYLAMLLPVVGVVQVGTQAHADRYTYLPQIGIYVAVAWLVAEWGAKWRMGRMAIGSLMTAVLVVLIICAWKQTFYWQNSETLWTHTLACTTGNYEARSNLGSALLNKGKVDDAITQFQEALRIDPRPPNIHNNLGIALYQKGRVDESVAEFQKALQLEPDDPWPKNNLAWLLATCPQASLRNGNKAVELATQANHLSDGENPIFLHTLAAAFAEAGRFSEAVETAQRALRLAKAQSKSRLAGQLQSEMKLYQAGSPMHIPAQAHYK